MIGMERRSERLRPARVQCPSISIRLSIRSSTSDSEIPKSLNVCGIAGLNGARTGAKVAIRNLPVGISSGLRQNVMHGLPEVGVIIHGEIFLHVPAVRGCRGGGRFRVAALSAGAQGGARRRLHARLPALCR